MKLENDGKVYYITSHLFGGPNGWAEQVMKNTLKAQQEEGTDCFLLTDGKSWCLLTEYKEEIKNEVVPEISEEYISDDY